MAVYLQAYKSHQNYFPLQEFQIWRANDPSEPLHPSVNLARQVDKGATVDPCTDLTFVSSTERVPLGSTTTNVGTDIILGDGNTAQAFAFRDSEGVAVDDKCFFTGVPYSTTVGSGIAGVLSCRGTTVQCAIPSINQATTCGGKAASECGILGKDCPDKFYQLIAICLM